MIVLVHPKQTRKTETSDIEPDQFPDRCETQPNSGDELAVLNSEATIEYATKTTDIQEIDTNEHTNADITIQPVDVRTTTNQQKNL